MLEANMIISELIVALQKAKEEHGDVIVCGFDSYSGGEYEFTTLRFYEASVEYSCKEGVPEGKNRITLDET